MSVIFVLSLVIYGFIDRDTCGFVTAVGLFDVTGYYGTGTSVGVSVVNSTASWSDAYQNCWSYQSQSLYADPSVSNLVANLVDINQMLNALNWEPTKHLWIGYAKNETTDLMAKNGTCVVGPSLPVTFTTGTEECVMLNVSATIEANLLYTAVCEEKHEYLCETPNLGEVNATRFVDLAILLYLVPNHVTNVLNKPDESSCEAAMNEKEMAFGAEFYRAHNVCHVHKMKVFEFPVTVTMDTTNSEITAFVKTGGYTAKILQESDIPTSHPSLIQNCLNTEELTITTTDVTPEESTTIPNIELSTIVVKTTIPNIETTTTVVKTTIPINDNTSTTSIDPTPVVTTTTVNPKTDFTTSVDPTTEATTTSVDPTTEATTTSVDPTTEATTTSVNPTTEATTSVNPTTEATTSVNPTTEATTSVNPTTEAIVTHSTVTDSFVANPYISTDTLLSDVGATYITSTVTDDTTQVDVMTTGALIGTDGTIITEDQGEVTAAPCILFCCLPEPELNTSNRPDITNSININLRLNKTLLGSYKRRHISINDSRLSSAVIGYCGVVILMAGSLTIIVPDVSLIVQCLKAGKRRHQFQTKVKLVSYRKP